MIIDYVPDLRESERFTFYVRVITWPQKKKKISRKEKHTIQDKSIISDRMFFSLEILLFVARWSFVRSNFRERVIIDNYKDYTLLHIKCHLQFLSNSWNTIIGEYDEFPVPLAKKILNTAIFYALDVNSAITTKSNVVR